MPLDRTLGLRLGVAAVLAVLLLVPFALIAVFVVGGWAPLHDADAAVSHALHAYALTRPGWVDVLLAISFVFSPTALRAAALVLVIWLVRSRRAGAVAAWTAGTMAIGGILGAVLKLLIGRDRPELLNPVAQATGYSFPSGHALNSALAAAVFLLVLLPYAGPRPGRRAALWAAAVLLPLVTGLSRVGLGVHYTSDVVAGWLLGVAVVAVSMVVFARWPARAGRHPVRAADPGVAPHVVRR